MGRTQVWREYHGQKAESRLQLHPSGSSIDSNGQELQRMQGGETLRGISPIAPIRRRKTAKMQRLQGN
jgi:hypothetical protein